MEREVFWSELGAILWNGPWCVAGDFNMIRFPSEEQRRPYVPGDEEVLKGG